MNEPDAGKFCIMIKKLSSLAPSRFCLLIFVVSYLGLFPLFFKNLRYSIYYRNPFYNSTVEMAYHLRQNDLRVAAALQFWKSLSQHNLSLGFVNPIANQKKVDIAVMIITTSRGVIREGKLHHPKFLTQILKEFMVILNSTETRALPWKINLSICDVDTKKNEEASSFSPYLPYFQRGSTQSEKVEQFNIKEKEKQDYAFCLEQSLKLNPRYSLLVEDDAFPHPQLFHILYYLLEIKKTQRVSHAANPTVFYKLYHPERLLGFWSLAPDRFLQLLSFAVFCGSSVAFVIDSVMSWQRKGRQWSIHFWIWTVMYFLLLAIAVSRQHLIELRYFWRNLFTVSSSPSCCTQGMLYLADKAPDWLHYMQTHTCQPNFAKDFMLDYYIQKYNLEGLIVEPNLFVHIVFFSSLSQKFLDPSLLYYPEWFKLY